MVVFMRFGTTFMTLGTFMILDGFARHVEGLHMDDG
jgi:hypothetical protein